MHWTVRGWTSPLWPGATHKFLPAPLNFLQVPTLTWVTSRALTPKALIHATVSQSLHDGERGMSSQQKGPRRTAFCGTLTSNQLYLEPTAWVSLGQAIHTGLGELGSAMITLQAKAQKDNLPMVTQLARTRIQIQVWCIFLRCSFFSTSNSLLFHAYDVCYFLLLPLLLFFH